MQSSGRFRFFAIALTLSASLFVLFTPAANGQKDRVVSDAVLAPGNPPLTESMVARFTGFQSWLLEIPLTQQQRQKVRAMLLQDWKKPEEIKNDLTWLSKAAECERATPENREFMRVSLQDFIIKLSRADTKNPDSQWWVAAYDEAHRPIAPGNPPLTESLVSRYTAFVCWLLEIPYGSTGGRMPSDPVQQGVRNALIQDWRNPLEVKKDMDFLNWQLALTSGSPEEREFVRSKAQPAIVKAIRSDTRDPNSQRLLAAYDAAHPVIAAGNPPLTRQAADAFTELWCFTQNQAGGPRVDCNRALKDSRAQQLAQAFPALPPEQQTRLGAMPQMWAALRVAWTRGSEADRQKMRAQWLSSGQPVQAGQPGQAATNGDPQFVAAQAAAERVNAFAKREASTVSDEELLAAAKDAEMVAQEDRRQATPELLKVAGTWDQLAGKFRAGKAAYVQQAQDNAVLNAAQNGFVMQHAVKMMGRSQFEMTRQLGVVMKNMGSGESVSPLSLHGMTMQETWNRWSK